MSENWGCGISDSLGNIGKSEALKEFEGGVLERREATEMES